MSASLDEQGLWRLTRCPVRHSETHCKEHALVRVTRTLITLALFSTLAAAGIKLADGGYTFNNTQQSGMDALVANDGNYLEIDYGPGSGGTVSYFWDDTTGKYVPHPGGSGSIVVNRDAGHRYEATDSYGFATFYPSS